MKDEIQKLINTITELVSKYNKDTGKNIRLMEVCGTHTMSIARYGLKQLLPQNVELISGPGCPVCVTSNEDIDYMIELSKQPDTILTTFGDMMRVPGSSTNLLQEKSNGADIRIVYSPMDALNIAIEEAQNKTHKKVVFLGIGFETTTPLSASIIKRSFELQLDNFSVFSLHKNMPGALDLIVNDENLNVDGFILPGHVCTITGYKQFDFLASKYNTPGVVSGFNAEEILTAIAMLCMQIVSGEAKIENAYGVAVKETGNINAQKAIEDVFETCDTTWRGLGMIKVSGYKIREMYSQYDSKNNFIINTSTSNTNHGCKCGDILKGKMSPKDCALFSSKCTPENPIGPCMVSSEGTCSAYYKYNI